MTEPNNADRARWARAALQAFHDRTRWPSNGGEVDDPDIRAEVLADLLGDLRHLVGATAFEECSHRGAVYYREEIAEAAEQLTKEEA